MCSRVSHNAGFQLDKRRSRGGERVNWESGGIPYILASASMYNSKWEAGCYGLKQGASPAMPLYSYIDPCNVQ